MYHQDHGMKTMTAWIMFCFRANTLTRTQRSSHAATPIHSSEWKSWWLRGKNGALPNVHKYCLDDNDVSRTGCWHPLRQVVCAVTQSSQRHSSRHDWQTQQSTGLQELSLDMQRECQSPYAMNHHSHSALDKRMLNESFTLELRFANDATFESGGACASVTLCNDSGHHWQQWCHWSSGIWLNRLCHTIQECKANDIDMHGIACSLDDWTSSAALQWNIKWCGGWISGHDDGFAKWKPLCKQKLSWRQPPAIVWTLFIKAPYNARVFCNCVQQLLSRSASSSVADILV